jgi:sigma-B regulation protein RsbU (phosphoserine phosphatase)
MITTDKVLDRIQEGRVGICEGCKESLEPELAVVCPDLTFCLGCMGDSEKRQLEDDLRQVQEVNRALLPRVPRGNGGWEIGVHYTPSRILSGDFYDVVYQAEPERMTVTLGDVAGKGIPAGLLRAGLQATLRALSTRCDSPEELLSLANENFVAASGAGRFASVFHGILENGTLVYANGGHLPPLLKRASGGWEKLEATGTVLGLLDDVCYEGGVVKLAPGDTLVLYTDGITEAEEPDGGFFDEHNLMAAVDSCAGSMPQAIAECVAEELESFSPGPQSDDRTLLILRRRGES